MQATPETQIPREDHPYYPGCECFRTGGLTRPDIEASIAVAGQSFGASDAVSAVLADSRIVQVNSSLDLTNGNDSVQLSVADSLVSTKLAMVNTSAVTHSRLIQLEKFEPLLFTVTVRIQQG